MGPQFKKDSGAGRKEAPIYEFAISRFSLLRRFFALVLTVLLCFSLFMSELTQFTHSHHFDPINKITPIYILLIAFSISMAIKTLVSVKELKIREDRLEISNLCWHEQLNWKELRTMQAPRNLKFAWLKGKNSFYLFDKREFENYDQLEALIGQYLSVKS